MTVPKGIGTDIIEIARIKLAHERHGERFLERILTQNERAYCARHQNPWPQIAGRFAAKEAVLKALGTGLVGEMTWHEIEVVNNEQGKPEVFLSKRMQKSYPQAHFLLSISHCETHATATALLME